MGLGVGKGVGTGVSVELGVVGKGVGRVEGCGVGLSGVVRLSLGLRCFLVWPCLIELGVGLVVGAGGLVGVMGTLTVGVAIRGLVGVVGIPVVSVAVPGVVGDEALEGRL